MSSPTIRILKLVKTEKKAVIFLLVLIILAAAFDIVVPFISQRLIDTLIDFFKQGGSPPLKVLIFSALGILAATLANRIVQSIYNFNLFKKITAIEDRIKHQAFEKYLKLHALFHHNSSGGQIIGRIERGVSAVYIIIHDIFGHNLVPPLIIYTGILAALAFKNMWVALAVLLPLPIYIFSVRRISGKIYEIEKRANEEFETVAKEAYDVAGNVLTVKKFSQETPETQNQARLQTQARQTQYAAEKLWVVIENIQTLIATLGRISVIILGGFLVLNQKSTVGEFVLYVTLQNMAFNPLWQLSHVLPRLRRNISRAERLFHILDEPIKITDKIGAKVLPTHQQSIEFKNVWFRYSENRAWAIKNLNVIIPAGSTVALVGRSGSGKTTLINLLLRSYDPSEGAVLIDGTDIREVTQEGLRNQMAVVPQEVDLFSRTIGENIAYGQPEATAEQISAAAETALAHDFIVKTENGYGTLVGERGIKLSGGERQRIGIARAILRDPRILIMDEATSHLDTESERLIQQATQNLIRGRTSIIIAHRLSTILNADMILVFHHGELEAAGTHQELLTQSPTYQRLYSLQFGHLAREFDLIVPQIKAIIM
ncbi:MAG: ABC transporter ATP-binding protein [Patescibacteria group bacterium]